MDLFSGEYSWELNSEDKFDDEAAMMKSKTTGGTMVMWKTSLDKYVSVHQVSSTSFLPIVFSPPGSPISVHFALYLPTAGRDAEYLEQITLLNNCIEDLKAKYEDPIIFLRGDGNTNPNNKARCKIFSYFLSSNLLSQANIGHKTYHHFLGGGSFDSSIDVLLYSSSIPNIESVTKIFCINDHPDMFSHHDAFLSSVLIPVTEPLQPEQDLLTAPRMSHSRKKIIWSEEGIFRYQEEVAAKLSDIRSRWLNPLSKTSLSILLSRTNDILCSAATKTNKSVDLNTKKEMKKVPKEVQVSRSNLKRISRNVSENNLKLARNRHKSLVRKLRSKDDQLHNEKLHSILTSNPSSAFSTIKSAKSGAPVQIPHIMVGERKYVGERVIDGFYDSLTILKSLDSDKLEGSPYHASLMEDYTHIKYLCSHKSDLPPISLEKSSEILTKMKPSVNDIYSITAKHFTNAGTAGHVHFNLLLNAFLIDINNCTVEELNTVFALLLYKGHKKERTLNSSYRTISTCPVLAKGLDMYVRELFIDKWNSQQADTQYQGEGSSHELASLLITETIQYSKFITKQPIFLLFLDAESAFDSVVIPYLVRNLYASGMEGHSVLFMENRLANRATFCEFDKVIAGPIYDEQGLEQGGVASSDLYKLYNNEVLSLAQRSGLGVDLGGPQLHPVSAVGQADDTVIVSNDLFKLEMILHLVLSYCKKYNVKLSSSKTKLLQICPPRQDSFIPYNPIKIDDKTISFVSQAEHVGVIRSVDGNMPNILSRIASFKKALGAITSCGLARGQRTNPTVSLRILSLYGTPVLMSGLGSLLLSSTETAMIDQQFKRTLQNILKLSVASPPSLVHFVAGSLPATALLHLRQLSLFGMVCRLKGDPLHQHAVQVLLTLPATAQSWFIQVRNLHLQYQLPHPLELLETPPTKTGFKKLAKSKVIDYWEQRLRSEASFLPSLTYFHPQFLSLTTPHKLWSTAGQNIYEVSKAKIQLLFLSSQYPCAKRTRHWSPDNPDGICSVTTCKEDKQVESPEHLLLKCPAYSSTRLQLISLGMKTRNPEAHQLFVKFLFSNTKLS